METNATKWSTTVLFERHSLHVIVNKLEVLILQQLLLLIHKNKKNAINIHNNIGKINRISI